MMALQKAQEGSGSAGRAGLNHSFQNLRKNKKRSRFESAFGFPLLSCKGYAARWRWAFLFLASRFASTPYLAPGYGLCEASPVALPFTPSGRVRREYTTTTFY